ncbi:DUF3592 domain-containing protein [Nocardia vinacea]|uniref:DUF3592 domain-containing protein n=1 Tax=Nocardia vinacea TaxID=96468 RepID=UPI00343E6BA8
MLSCQSRLTSGRWPGGRYAVDGKRYTTRTTTRNVLHTYSTGERVPVAYDPTDPADAQVADPHSTYAGRCPSADSAC